MASGPVERKLAAILSADVVGYARMMADDEAATVRTLSDYREEIGLLVRQHRGRVVDTAGDSLLAEFLTATDAVSCAVNVQGSLGENFLQQQEKFDDFIDEYNQERPHQALGMKFPAELYTRSRRPYHGLEDLDYPLHDKTVTVTQCGRVCFKRKKIHLSTVFAGQNVGIKQVDDKIWLVTFMQYDLGFFDEETARLGSAENPFGAKVLPMSPV